MKRKYANLRTCRGPCGNRFPNAALKAGTCRACRLRALGAKAYAKAHRP